MRGISAAFLLFLPHERGIENVRDAVPVENRLDGFEMLAAGVTEGVADGRRLPRTHRTAAEAA